jgi:DNA invertase Pin-like site-specific DNA recombinase
MNQDQIKLKYFIYARKSSESEDRQMASIESQIDELKKLAQQEGLEVVRIFSEAKSAKAPGRPIFNEMLAEIHKGEVKGILCWKLNRLARNPIDGGQISWMIQQSIIGHIQTYGRSYYPSDNVLVMSVELGIANQFIRDLSIDTKRGLRSKAERGWYPTYTTLGYMHNPLKRKGEKEVIKDPERFELVKKAFDLMLTGAYTPPKILDIANNEWGLRTKAGRKVARSTIYRIFSDPFYYGEYEFPKGSGIWYHGSHEAMITKDEYKKIQDIV